MSLTGQPIYSYEIDHTALDVFVKEDVAGRLPSASPDQDHLCPHLCLDPFSRLIIAVTLDVQAIPSSLSASDLPNEGL